MEGGVGRWRKGKARTSTYDLITLGKDSASRVARERMNEINLSSFRPKVHVSSCRARENPSSFRYGRLGVCAPDTRIHTTERESEMKQPALLSALLSGSPFPGHPRHRFFSFCVQPGARSLPPPPPAIAPTC
jgi:hypothetical protein